MTTNETKQELFIRLESLALGVIIDAADRSGVSKELVWEAYQTLTALDSDLLDRAGLKIGQWILGVHSSDLEMLDSGECVQDSDGNVVDLTAGSLVELMRVTQRESEPATIAEQERDVL